MTTLTLNRRRLLATLGSAAITGVARPYLSRAADRPLITHGIQSGDVSADSGDGLGARGPAGADAGRGRDHRELQDDPSAATFVDALPDSDFTAKALLEGLPAGQDIFYRVRFAGSCRRRPSSASRRSAASAPRRADRRSVSFVWSGDTAGQGWGIDEARGGMRTYATMLQEPARLLHPLRRHHLCRRPDRRRSEAAGRQALEEPRRPRRSRSVAETLAEFRGNYKYNLLDENLRAFNAEVPMFAQWDDHEVTNNWWPGEDLTGDEHRRRIPAQNALARGARQPRLPRISCRSAQTPAEAGRVYRKISYGPLLDVFMLDMRSYRGPNGAAKEELWPGRAFPRRRSRSRG